MSPLKITAECEKNVQAWDGYCTKPSAENRLKESIPLYRNNFVDKYLASSHPMSPLFWWGPVIAYGLYQGFTSELLGWGITPLLFLAGIIGWTFLEYVFHRWLFHLNPGSNFNLKIFFYMLHAYHHDFPNHGRRLVAPPLMAALLGSISVIVFFLVLGFPYFLPFIAGFFTGYLAYDWIHFYTHHFRPKNKIGKFLREYHLVHHYKHFESNFGISNPFWDMVFGTYVYEKENKKLQLSSSY